MKLAVYLCLLLAAFWAPAYVEGVDDDPNDDPNPSDDPTPSDDDPTPSGPTPFTYPYNACAPSHGSPLAKRESLAIGDTAYLCVNINGVMTSFFNVKVDEFSAISFQGSNYALPGGSGFLQSGVGFEEHLDFDPEEQKVFYHTFDVASHFTFSPFPRIYKKLNFTPADDGSSVAKITTFPLWTVIIKVTDGVIEDIGWDDGCFFCARNGDDCEFSGFDVETYLPYTHDTFRSCHRTHDECYPVYAPPDNSTTPTNDTITSETECDLKIFVTWTGTDKNGNYLRSVNKRFSRYQAFSIATAYQSALNLVAKGVNLAERAKKAAESVPGRIFPKNQDRRLEYDVYEDVEKQEYEPIADMQRRRQEENRLKLVDAEEASEQLPLSYSDAYNYDKLLSSPSISNVWNRFLQSIQEFWASLGMPEVV